MDIATRNILRGAKERIVESWGQGNGCDPPKDSNCILTAITAALRTLGPESTERRGLLREETEKLLALAAGIPLSPVSCPGYDLYQWNDASGRTQEQVVALIDSVLNADSAPVPSSTRIEEEVYA